LSGPSAGDWRERLSSAAAAIGFHRVRWLRAADLPPPVRGHPAAAALGDGLYLMAALSCHRREPDDLSASGDPHALVAPFARRNYYREAVARLKAVTAGLGGSLAAEGGRGGADRRTRGGSPETVPRLFSNSRLPEKALAAACGLGFLGSHSLLIAPALGSAFLIAGAFLPACLVPQAALRQPSDPPLPEGLRAGGGCGTCRACLRACPVGAITAPGVVDRERCLPSLSTRLGPWPPEVRAAWGFRLYGCQDCQDACPHNRELRFETATPRGEIGPSVPLRRLLACDEQGVREMFRGTALARSWIPPAALQRNGLLAAAARRDPAVLPMVRSLREAPVRAVRQAASWAQEALARG
jgi:epoxyqueuosine reductase